MKEMRIALIAGPKSPQPPASRFFWLQIMLGLEWCFFEAVGESTQAVGCWAACVQVCLTQWRWHVKTKSFAWQWNPETRSRLVCCKAKWHYQPGWSGMGNWDLELICQFVEPMLKRVDWEHNLYLCYLSCGCVHSYVHSCQSTFPIHCVGPCSLSTIAQEAAPIGRSTATSMSVSEKVISPTILDSQVFLSLCLVKTPYFVLLVATN